MLGATLGSMKVALGDVVYQNDFESAALGSIPDEFLVLDGQFSVEETEAGRALVLPGAPLDNFGVLFGPNEKGNVAVSARVRGDRRGRLYPAFGVGICGISGFLLKVSPSKRVVELLQSNVVKATAPFKWQAGKWARLQLRIRRGADGVSVVEGRVWQEGDVETPSCLISFRPEQAPPFGKASVWGFPFSSKPIFFDDLKVVALTEKS